MPHAPNRPPGFFLRMSAAFYDGLLIIALWMIATLVALIPVAVFTDAPLVAETAMPEGPGEEIPASVPWIEDQDIAALEQRQMGDYLAGNTLFQAWLVLVTGLFFAWFWARAGQTLGMRAWRLRIVDTDGRGLSGRTLWMRLALVMGMVMALVFATAFLASDMWPNSWGVLLLAPVMISCCWSLVDPERRMLHDILAGTRFIRLPAKD